MVLRLSSPIEQVCPYADVLLDSNIQLIEKPTLETAYRAINDGCRVGLVIIREEQDLHQHENDQQSMLRRDRPNSIMRDRCQFV